MDIAKQLLDVLLDGVMVLAVAIVPILVRAAIAWAEKKTALDFSDKQEERVEKLVNDAIHYAEESAHKRLNAGEAEMGEPGKKLEKALAFASKEAERLGLLSLVEGGAEHLADMIESKLGAKRHDHKDAVDNVPMAAEKEKAKADALAAAESSDDDE